MNRSLEHDRASRPLTARPGVGVEMFVTAWDAAAGGVAPRRRRRWGIIREAVRTALVVALVFVVTQSAVAGREVEGPSMEPAYHTGQVVFINRLVYRRLDGGRVVRALPFGERVAGQSFLFHGPRRGEVIVFRPPFPSRTDLIKRVIAVPGDHLQIAGGIVTVNGEVVAEPYVRGLSTACAGTWCDVTLGPDQYYVLGDNRPLSSDSRIWGPVHGQQIRGKAWVIVRPLNEIGPAR